MPEMEMGSRGDWSGGRNGGRGGNGDHDWSGGDNRDRGDRDWDRGGRNGRDHNDWNRGGRDHDWNRPRIPVYRYPKRRYNHVYNPRARRYDAWWYPYWNQFVAPIINPIAQWFWPYPVTPTYPGYGYPAAQPHTVIPGTYW